MGPSRGGGLALREIVGDPMPWRFVAHGRMGRGSLIEFTKPVSGGQEHAAVDDGWRDGSAHPTELPSRGFLRAYGFFTAHPT